MMFNYKMIFLPMLILSTLITITANNWLSMWLGLEINLLSIIPLMMSKKNCLSAEAIFKYFLIQAMASSIILFSIIIYSFKLMENFYIYTNLILNTGILMKLGAAPFHFWFPEVLEGLSWNLNTLVLTWQKIAPMIMLNYSMNSYKFIIILIMFSMMFSGIFGMNQISIHKFMTFSSINHMGWMMSALFFLESIWISYFLVYSIITLTIIAMLNKLKINQFNQMNLAFNKSPLLKFLFFMNLLSMMGIPPFLGFFPKWITIQMLILNNQYLLSLSMVMLTLLTMFFYMQFITPNIMMINTNMNLFNHMKLKSSSMVLINFFIMMSLPMFTLASSWL